MTSNTLPSGYIVTSSNSSATAWQEFNRTTESGYTLTTGVWLQLQFPTPNDVTYYEIQAGVTTGTFNFKLEGSSNGTDWNLVDSRTVTFASNFTYGFNCNSPGTAYNYWRISNTGINSFPLVGLTYFIGGEGDIYPPNMLSNTAPVPFIASASSNQSDSPPWEAFDNNQSSSSSIWRGFNGSYPMWLQIFLNEEISVASYTLGTSYNSASDNAPLDWEFQGSNDKLIWETLDTQTGITWSNVIYVKQYVLPIPSIGYKYFRVSISAGSGGAVPTNASRISSLRVTGQQPSSGTPSKSVILQDFRIKAVLPPVSIQNFRINSPIVGIMLNNFRVDAPQIGVTLQDFRIKAVSPPIVIQNHRLNAIKVGVMMNDLRVKAVPPPVIIQDNRFYVATPVQIDDFRVFAPAAPVLLNNFRVYEELVVGVIIKDLSLHALSPSVIIKDFRMAVAIGVIIDDMRFSSPPPPINIDDFRMIEANLDGVYVTNLRFNRTIENHLLSKTFPVAGFGIYEGNLNHALPYSTYQAMTSHTTPAPLIASASSEYSGGSYPAWKAFNYVNNAHTDCWLSLSGQPMPQWVQLNLKSSSFVISYAITTANEATSRVSNPRDWYFQGSYDGFNFVTIDTQVNQTALSQNVRTVYTIPEANRRAFSCYRLYITANNGGTYVDIGKLELLNNENPVPNHLFPSRVVLDKKMETVWTGSTTTPLTFFTEKAQPIKSYSITSTLDSNPKTFSLEGSIDGVTFSPIDYQQDTTGWQGGVTKVFTLLSSTQPFKYFKFDWLDNYNTTGEVQIAEIDFFKEKIRLAYYESVKPSFHAFAAGFNDVGTYNILLEGPSKTFIDLFEGNTFVESKFRSNGSVAISGKYRIPWIIGDEATLTLDENLFLPGTPIFWNGQPELFTSTNETPVMTSNTTPSGYVTSASSDNSGTSPAWYAFDNSGLTYWRPSSGQQAAGYLQIQLPTPTLIKAVTITLPQDPTLYTPKNFRFRGSNDGAVWTVLSNVIGKLLWVNYTATYYFLENIVPYSYYRLDVDATNVGTTSHFGIQDLKFYSIVGNTPTEILDQYGNKGVVTGVVGVVDPITYAGFPVLKLEDGANISFARSVGFNKNAFTLECKFSPLTASNSGATSIFSGALAGYNFNVDYNYSNVGFDLYLSSTGTSWDISLGGNHFSYQCNDGIWYHIKFSYDGFIYRLEVNGIVGIMVPSTARISIFNNIQMGREASGRGGYFFDFRYFPICDDPAKDYLIPFDQMLRFNPQTNLSYLGIDKNIAYTNQTSRWVETIAFPIAEINKTNGNLLVDTEYAYNGITVVDLTDLQQATGTPDFFKVYHNFGVSQAFEELLVMPDNRSTLFELYDSVRMTSIGMISGSASWSGERIGKTLYRNYIGIKWPANDSADYGAIYSGSGVVQNISGTFLRIRGIINRGF